MFAAIITPPPCNCIFTRRATSAHTGVEAGFRHPREGDRRVFGSCGPPSARPRAARESSPSPRAPGAGWSGSVPPAVPVLRPTAGFQTGRARAQCAPGAHVMRLGTARPAWHGAVPGRGATWYAGPGIYGLPPESRPCPGVAVVRLGLVPRRTAPPKGSLPRGKAARRVRSNNHTTTTDPQMARTGDPLPPEGLGPLRILLGVLLPLSVLCSPTFSPNSPLPPSPCPRPPHPSPVGNWRRYGRDAHRAVTGSHPSPIGNRRRHGRDAHRPSPEARALAMAPGVR